jgi:PBP1b-binding outer membrane lipoprotein LpoB
MKKYGTLLAAIMILSSCENDSNKEESPGWLLMKTLKLVPLQSVAPEQPK